jgi:hypothetical protein
MDELIPIDEVILVTEASMGMPYHEIKAIFDYIESQAENWRINAPPEVTEILKAWEKFLIENY